MKSSTGNEIDVGILTIVPTEIDALFSTFGISREQSLNFGGPLDYWRTSLENTHRADPISIVVSFVTGDQGNVEAAVSTSVFLNDWTPRLMCMVGIAGGLSGRAKICDVVLPNKIHDRSLKVFSGGTYSTRGSTFLRPDTVNRQLKVRPLENEMLNFYCADRTGVGRRVSQIARRVGLLDSEFGEEFNVIDGSLVTDNVLIRDPEFLNHIRNNVDEKCRGGEMEGGGFLRACNYIDPKMAWLISRGISDFGDDRKDDLFQQVAALNACGTLKAVLARCIKFEDLPVTHRAIRRSSAGIGDLLLAEVKKSFDLEAWEEVCRLGQIFSRMLWLSGRYETRLEVGRFVEMAADYCDQPKLRALTLIDDLGWTNYKIGLTKLAIKNIKDGIRIGLDAEFFYGVAKGYRHLASISRRAQDLESASEFLKFAYSISEKVRDPVEEMELKASLYLSEAKLSMKLSNVTRAAELLAMARSLFSSLGDKVRLVKTETLVSELRIEPKEHQDLITHLEIVVNLFIDVGRVESFIDIASKLADRYESEERRPSSLLVRRVLEFADRNGMIEIISGWTLFNKEAT